MLIQLERISAQRIRGSPVPCTAPRCAASATWLLIDREMPEQNSENIGERPCCAAHITTTYLNLRGANAVARRAPLGYSLRPWIDRRRKTKRISLASAARDGRAEG